MYLWQIRAWNKWGVDWNAKKVHILWHDMSTCKDKQFSNVTKLHGSQLIKKILYAPHAKFHKAPIFLSKAGNILSCYIFHEWICADRDARPVDRNIFTVKFYSLLFFVGLPPLLYFELVSNCCLTDTDSPHSLPSFHSLLSHILG